MELAGNKEASAFDPLQTFGHGLDEASVSADHTLPPHSGSYASGVVYVHVQDAGYLKFHGRRRNKFSNWF
jgi:hypothetical protein